MNLDFPCLFYVFFESIRWNLKLGPTYPAIHQINSSNSKNLEDLRTIPLPLWTLIMSEVCCAFSCCIPVLLPSELCSLGSFLPGFRADTGCFPSCLLQVVELGLCLPCSSLGCPSHLLPSTALTATPWLWATFTQHGMFRPLLRAGANYPGACY